MLKNIIDEKHRDTINTFLRKKQGNARERIIRNYDELIDIIEKESNEIPPISKSAKAGCKLIVRVGANKFPSSYKYIPIGTKVEIEFRKDGKAELISVCRENVNRGKKSYWQMTDKAKNNILESLNIY